MKKLHITTWSAVVGLLLAAGSGLAQVSADGMGKVLPVELYACTYNDGQGPAELEKVITRWSKYMDDNDTNNYAAWTLTPVYYGEEQDFDLIWLGAYKDGNAMGEGTDNWLATGGELQAAFDKVLTCNAHIAMASAMYKAPADNATPSSGFLTMMDCKLNEGHRYPDIKSAEMKWAKYLADSGSKAGYWHWFPLYGGGDADFDYKVVFAYPDFAEIGTSFERMANGGGREMSEDIFGDVDECDDARVYAVKSRRLAQIRE